MTRRTLSRKMCHLSFLTFSCKVALSSCLDFTVHLRLFYIHVFLQRVYLRILYKKFRIFRCTRATTAMRYQKLTLATTRFAGSQFGNNGPVRLSYNPYFSACFFNRNSVFSHNRSAGTVFRFVFSAKRTEPSK